MAQEIPFFEGLVKDGKLPPMQERLPENPLQLNFEKTNKTIGKYGGDLRLIMGKAKDLGQITVYTYARLVGYAEDFTIQPDIAEAYHVAEGRDFTFKLRQGHRWSDGHPVTSEDFRYFWEDMVKNEKLGKKGVPAQLLVDGEEPTFTVVDELTFRYTWEKPNPSFLPALAAPSPLYIYRPAHYMKQFHEKYADKDELSNKVANNDARDWGALHTRKQRQRRPENPELPTLQAWRNTTPPPSTRFIFERNPYFHRVDPEGRQLPYIDRLVMSVVSKDVVAAKAGTGEADLQARYLQFSDVPYLKRGEKRNNFTTRLWSLGRGSQVALFPNLNANDEVWRTVLQDVRFRRALSLGINRKEINEVIYFGLAYPSANTVMPQSKLYKAEYSQMWAEYDRDKANALLDEIGLDKRDADGTRLLPDGRRAEITIETAGESSEETDVLELITDHYREIGLKIFIRSSQRDIFRRRAAAGETLISVFSGLNNAVATETMNPEELAPTDEAQLQWPKWGQYASTNTKAGEPIDLDGPMLQLQLFNKWMLANTNEERMEIWHEMLSGYTNQVFSIGTVNNSRQPVVVSNDLRNVPQEGIYAWEPTSYFGIYKPDTFWYDR
jgi:peptide/nickel transport system substrate-binding protein